MSGFTTNKKTSGYIHTKKRQDLPPRHIDHRLPVFRLCAYCSLQPLGVDSEVEQLRGLCSSFTHPKVVFLGYTSP